MVKKKEKNDWLYGAFTSAGWYKTEYVITVYCTTDTRNYFELLAKTLNKGDSNEHAHELKNEKVQESEIF